jgi:signal transduction histidine kinase
MFRSEDGTQSRCVQRAAAGFEGAFDADPHGDWLESLLHSREVAACVISVEERNGRADYCFVAVSPAFAAATGLHDVVGHSMRELRPDHEQYWFDMYARVASTGEAASFEHTARALDRRFSGHAFRIGGPDAWFVVAVFENSAKMGAGDFSIVPANAGDARLERFGATLAHELRGPLAALSNGMNIVKRGANDTNETRWALAMMERQIERLSSLIDDLLDVGRLGSSQSRVEREHVNLRHVISESIEACGPAMDARRHEVTVSSDGAELVVRGDQRRLTQVFCNLLTNSIKYTAPGGLIRVSMSRDGDAAVVEVRDNGIGIVGEELPHVFDYFKQGGMQTNQPGGGLGIGLSIVRSIVKLHDGTVSVHSDGAGQGSAFTVRLPLISSSV